MEEKIHFKDSEGNVVQGILSDPGENSPIVIVGHGFSSHKNSETYLLLTELLNEVGIATFRIDFYGHGESDGKFEDVTISKAVDDILQAIEYLKSRNYSTIGLFGRSFGGICSTLATSRSKDIKALVLSSPVSNYLEDQLYTIGKKGIKKWKERGFAYYEGGSGKKLKLNYSFFEDFDGKNDGYEAAKDIKIPVLILHGDADDEVPISQSEKLVSLLPDGKLEVLKGIDHDYKNKKNFKEIVSLAVDFFVGNLK